MFAQFIVNHPSYPVIHVWGLFLNTLYLLYRWLFHIPCRIICISYSSVSWHVFQFVFWNIHMGVCLPLSDFFFLFVLLLAFIYILGCHNYSLLTLPCVVPISDKSWMLISLFLFIPFSFLQSTVSWLQIFMYFSAFVFVIHISQFFSCPVSKGS